MSVRHISLGQDAANIVPDQRELLVEIGARLSILIETHRSADIERTAMAANFQGVNIIRRSRVNAVGRISSDRLHRWLPFPRVEQRASRGLAHGGVTGPVSQWRIRRQPLSFSRRDTPEFLKWKAIRKRRAQGMPVHQQHPQPRMHW